MKSISLTSLFWAFAALVLAGVVSFFVLHDEISQLGYQRVVSSASINTQAACSELASKFVLAEQSGTFSSDRRSQFESALLEIVLDHYDGIEGGFWSSTSGFSAYAFPSYDGTGKKTDVPSAETSRIAGVARTALYGARLSSDTFKGRREASIVSACPVSTGEVVWTMTRTSLAPVSSYESIAGKFPAVAIVLGLLTLAFGVLLFVWGRQLALVAADLGARVARNDRLRNVGEMASGVAHDLREPLSTMRLKLENALVDPGARAAVALPVALSQIDKMDRLIEMILAMTRPFQLVKQPVDLRQWFATNFEAARATAQAKNVSLEFVIGATSWVFDPLQLSRAVSNVVENAISYTPVGGRASVEVSRGAEDVLLIDIHDSGPGLLRAEFVFESGVSDRDGGTGLGLALSKEIVEAHGGRIRLMNGDHTGAWFRMEIPADGKRLNY